MKKRAIEKIKPLKPRKKKNVLYQTTISYLDEIIIFDIYIGQTWKRRHCFNAFTKEFATFIPSMSKWTAEKIEGCYGVEKDRVWYYNSWTDEKYKRMILKPEDEDNITYLLPEESFSSWRAEKTIIDTISRLETEYCREKREKTEMNRVERVNALMKRVPNIPAGIRSWLDERTHGSLNYCLKDQENKEKWGCTACGEEFAKNKLKKEDKTAPKDGDMVICPKCKAKIKLQTRRKKVELFPHFQIIQPIDDEVSVARHFSADIYCVAGKKKEIAFVEDVRIILHKNSTKTCDIYYEQFDRCYIQDATDDEIYYGGCFDNKSNPERKKEFNGFLWDGGIEEAFKGTHYEPWTRLFVQMSAAGMELNYNCMMAGVRQESYIRLIEMLFRGRFYKLLQEESNRISYWSGLYCGGLKLDSKKIEDVFGIQDMQRINRIRDVDGGGHMVEWMQWSERHEQKISEKAMKWLSDNNITTIHMQWMKCRFSIEQAMNYLQRQKKESYPTASIKEVINQYEDYMSMCKKLKKDTSDEMVYRPKELKRRHDEAVAEIAAREEEIKAEEYSAKYGATEQVLQGIKEKFEYSGEKYFIIVPERIVDIVEEGRSLHHCAGSTDRYFDRIKQNETYICFLRKAAEPKVPYYTIEVEPGGTIRQHRGMFDEEPEIEEVKPFLREWQKEIRKRMSEQDHKLAEISKTKREENIEDLKKQNNTRVLQGLMEDFMEAEV